jgi:hypothetical protein
VSRYKIYPKNPIHDVTVGFDPPFNTYFSQVEDITIPEDSDLSSLVFWCGNTPDEINSLQQLQDLVAPYAVIPDEVLKNLASDAAQPWQPTPFQRDMINIVREMNKRG